MCINKIQKGVGLLEVLVALFIFSFALLGLLKMIHFNINEQAKVFKQTQVSLLLYDLVEKIQLNSNQDYSLKNFTKNVDVLSQVCEFKSCTHQELRDYDLNHWLYYLKKISLDATGSIVKQKNGYLIEVNVNEVQSLQVKVITNESGF